MAVNFRFGAFMRVFSTYAGLSIGKGPIILTIGKFDGLHLGHLALLSEAKRYADQLKGTLVVITFKNHPLEVLNRQAAISKIYSQSHKLKLFEEHGVDVVIELEFTVDFSNLTAEQFIEELYKHLQFKILVLGHDARIGKGRQGNSNAMLEISKKFRFKLEYIQPFQCDGKIVSSSLIKQAILRGDLKEAAKLLGRKFSLWLPDGLLKVHKGFAVPPELLVNLCLPPKGSYPVEVCQDHLEDSAIAHVDEHKGHAEIVLHLPVCIDPKMPLEIVFYYTETIICLSC